MILPPKWVSKVWRERYLRRNSLSTAELDQFQKLDAAAQKVLLVTRLQAQIAYFAARADALPEWKEAAQIRDPEAFWQAWPRLPIVTKEMLRQRFPASEIGRRFQIEGQVKSTGGSTGEPTAFFHDTEMTKSIDGLSDWTAGQMGWRPGMAKVILWGAEEDIGRHTPLSARIYHALARNEVVAGYNLTEATARRVRHAVAKHSPVAMYGFTSMLAEVARTLLASGQLVPEGSVAVAWNGGEALLPAQNEVFKRVFHTPILNRYGSREMGSIAHQQTEAGPLLISRPWYVVDIVDDDGRPAQPGEPGSLLVTSTICRGTPFLRYRIGDAATFDIPYRTESGITALSSLDGRLAGIVQLADGRKINNIVWNHLFKEFAEVEQFQVVVQKNGFLRIRLKGAIPAGTGHGPLHQAISRLLRDNAFEISWVDEIPLTSRGKLLQVVQEGDESAGAR